MDNESQGGSTSSTAESNNSVVKVSMDGESSAKIILIGVLQVQYAWRQVLTISFDSLRKDKR
jgi:hypothetical protein